MEVKGLYLWGQGQQGQLGNGELQNCHTPQLIEDISLANVRGVFLGFCHSAVVGYDDDILPVMMDFMQVC